MGPDRHPFRTHRTRSPFSRVRSRARPRVRLIWSDASDASEARKCATFSIRHHGQCEMNRLYLPKKDPRLSWPDRGSVRRLGAQVHGRLVDEQ
jgi:hypothetical protein